MVTSPIGSLVHDIPGRYRAVYEYITIIREGNTNELSTTGRQFTSSIHFPAPSISLPFSFPLLGVVFNFGSAS